MVFGRSFGHGVGLGHLIHFRGKQLRLPVISSPSVPRPRHYPGGMDVTGVSQLLGHPTPGGTEYRGELAKIPFNAFFGELIGTVFPLLGEISVWRSVMTGIT